MKKLSFFLSHFGTVTSLMLLVFLCINSVNEAMAFYDHPFTKLLLILTCACLTGESLLLRRPGRQSAVLCLILCLFAALQAALALVALVLGYFSFYADAPGQVLAFCTCLLTLSLSFGLRLRNRS